MSRPAAVRLATTIRAAAAPRRSLTASSRLTASHTGAPASTRFLSTTPIRREKDDPYHESSTASTGTSAGPHEGSASRTDNQIVIEYPEDESEFPSEPAVQGRGGVHLKRTLPTFSLEGRTAVVTGGARGLGLVMGQALINSGADLAIVDLNSRS
jgi:D-arabinitol 2-dehydrogenase